MSTSHILTLLIEDRDRIQAAIDALSTGSPAPVSDPANWVTGKKSVPEPAAPKKRKVSAAARRKMAEGQKRRWAAIDAAKAEATAPKKKSSKAAIAEVIAPAADADFKAKMSAALRREAPPARNETYRKMMSEKMKAAWAKRKKAAKKS
jgi:hypothetical protein